MPHWLDRDPSRSPGLRRIKEVQQDVAVAKARVALTEIQRKQDLENFRLKLLSQAAIIEQRVIKIEPLLEEIRDFANRTGSFPVGVDPEELGGRDGVSFEKNTGLMLIQPSTVKQSKVIVAKGPSPRVDFPESEICKEALPGWDRAYDLWDGYNNVKPEPELVIDVGHGYKGVIVEALTGGGGGEYGNSSDTEVSDASINYGIRIVVASDGKIELLKQDLVDVPSGRGIGGVQLPGGKMLKENWVILPEDDKARKQLLAEAFHNPAYLGAEKIYIPTEPTFQPAEPQTNTGIESLVKGLLGLK